jgi:hypothetical protein
VEATDETQLQGGGIAGPTWISEIYCFLSIIFGLPSGAVG